ncbi:ABC transporter substrate-binding protein [Aquabacterium sp.]|uniref:ABC transporter substrate-binding protein n=1 Tax=Aquabacterium sp. TaxID=1872578 RepID=UPI0035C6EF28
MSGMRRHVLRDRLAGLMLTAWMAWCMGIAQAEPAPAPVQVVDDRQVTARWAQPPQRIVTLLPSLTETVCELGECARLVGTDRYSTYPAAVRKLPKVGGLDDASVEAIVALRPDVVLLGASSRIIDRLTSLGIKVVALEPRSQPDVQRVIGKVATVLGRDAEGARLWRRIEDELRAAAAAVPAGARGRSVYYEVDAAPFAAGESSFIGAMLKGFGLINVVPEALGPFPKLNPEFVVRANPAVIMVASRSAASLPTRPGWQAIEAVRERRVCAFAADETDVLSRPGPRMGEAARLMLRCLQGLSWPASAAPAGKGR